MQTLVGCQIIDTTLRKHNIRSSTKPAMPCADINAQTQKTRNIINSILNITVLIDISVFHRDVLVHADA
jgi:hypothetical protein